MQRVIEQDGNRRGRKVDSRHAPQVDKYKVPAAEQTALFEIVGKTKADIVVRK
jgi:hypothetical protein